MIIFKIVRNGVQSAFSRHLLLTNVTISFSLSAAGDFLQQHYRIKLQEQQSWDKLRTRNMTCTGVTVGVLCHHWYQLLDQRLPGRTVKTVMKKLIIDQLLFSPVCITVFIATLSLLHGLNNYMDNVKDYENGFSFSSEKLNEEYLGFKRDMSVKGWKLYVAEWVVWPPAQLINFYFLPLRYRVLYDNTISLLYDIYASHVVYYSNKESVRIEKRGVGAVGIR